MTQGEIPFNNSAFRVDRYPADHPAFAGRDLTPNGTLELDGSAVFEIRQVDGSASEVTLSWASIPNVTYHVQHTQSLVGPGSGSLFCPSEPRGRKKLNSELDN
jgi:hypothetical protein